MDFVFKGTYRPFAKSSEEEWGLNGVAYDPATTVFKTRDSAINSVRCMMASMDDPSRGQQESTNVKVHQDIVQLYRGDFADRFKNQDDKFVILTGTMYNPNDVFALEIAKAMDGAFKDLRFKNTYINKEKKTIVIVNDCEDENGNSAYPEFISNEALAEKREGLDPYDYACVWRQKPIPAEGLLFDYNYLKTYDSLPENTLNKTAVAFIDPTRRRAKDFFSMPISRYNPETDEYYLIDAIFTQKASVDLYDEVVNKIISHKILKVVIEENIDGSLATVITDKLKAKGVKWCEIVNKYATANKSARIAEYANTVKKTIVFPAKGKYGAKTQVGMFMYNLTSYSAMGGNNFDDGPDSICGFADEFIVSGTKQNKLRALKKLPI